MSLVYISKLHLKVALGHWIMLFYIREVHSYQTLDLMDPPSWNGSIMLFAWKFEHNHQKCKQGSLSSKCWSHILCTIYEKVAGGHACKLTKSQFLQNIKYVYNVIFKWTLTYCKKSMKTIWVAKWKGGMRKLHVS
jgi:hypothetical protein